MTNEYEPIEEKEINLRDYIQVVRNRKKVAIAFFIFTNVIVALYTFTATLTLPGVSQIDYRKERSQPA